MRGLLVAALALLSACAQLFGIDETTSAVPPGKAGLTLTRQSIGATVVPSPFDVSHETSTFYVPNAADPTMFDAIPGEQTATNTWQATVGDATPFVKYSLPDLPTPFSRVLALPSTDVRAHFVVYEHPSP